MNMNRDELILALCCEAGDDVTDADAAIDGFCGNHAAADIDAAAAGDPAALIRLRYACGLPLVT